MNRCVFEQKEGRPLATDELDGMADALADAEAAGFEGEHVWDASVEGPPHPFWNAVTGRCHDEVDGKAPDEGSGTAGA